MEEESSESSKLKFCAALSRYFPKILFGWYLEKEEANFSEGRIL
jgi:hypothetical protein